MSKLRRLLRYDWPLHFVLLLMNWLPDNSIFLRLRGRLAKPFFGHCGKNLKLQRCVTFYNPEKISIGSNVRIAYGCRFIAGGTIQIEDEVIIGPYCVIVSSHHTRQSSSFYYGERNKKPIYMKRGCWIAAHVTVTAGSTVGNGSLVAAGAVVSGELPENCLAGGQPAKALKYYDE